MLHYVKGIGEHVNFKKVIFPPTITLKIDFSTTVFQKQEEKNVYYCIVDANGVDNIKLLESKRHICFFWRFIKKVDLVDCCFSFIF